MNLETIEKHIGTQIKMLRISKKISQKDLAATMGITYQQVQKYEMGQNRISVARLWQLCKIFEISPNALFESVLDEAAPTKANRSIPNQLATSQDIKLMLAFKKIEDGDKRNLVIRMCEALSDSEALESEPVRLTA